MPFARILIVAAVFLASAASVSADPERWTREGWKTDFSKHAVPFTDILSGGPPKDGIPSIDNPKFIKASDDTALGDKEPVIRVESGGTVRAYPLRVMMWHEIVNDVVAGTPLTITYCPLCNSAIVFERKIGDKVLDFGTTGKLRNSDLVMYDRQTESWWQQFTGEAIIGSYMGAELKMVPARVEAFKDFKTANPDADVLVPNNPSMRDYGRNPYRGYDSSAQPFLFRGDMPDGIEPMARVVVIKDGKAPKAIALTAIRARGPVELGAFVVSWRSGQNSALDSAQISEGRDVGSVDVVRKTASGTEPVVHDVTFAFVAHAFYPKIEIITE